MENLISRWKVVVLPAALWLGACGPSAKDSGDEGAGDDGATSAGTDDGASGDGETNDGDGDDGDGDDGDGDGGTGDSGSKIPVDLRPYFERVRTQCTGVFTGHGQEAFGPGGASGAVPCRHDGASYELEVQLEGEPTCLFQGEDADCSHAAEGTVYYAGDLVADGTTYVVAGSAWVHSDDDGDVDVSCPYDVEDPDPDQLPNLEESWGEMGLGLTHARWRHDEDGAEWEYCDFVMEEHTPPE